MSNKGKGAAGKNDRISLKIREDDGLHSVEKTLHNYTGKYGSYLNNPNLRRIQYDISRPLKSEKTRRNHSATHNNTPQISGTPKAVSNSHDLELLPKSFLIRPQSAARMKIPLVSRAPSAVPEIMIQTNSRLLSNKASQQPESMKSPQSQDTAEEHLSKETDLVCPLEYADLPPTTEYDHKILKCYCYLCICGNHMCPGELIHTNISPSSIYSTIYHIDFTKKPIMPSLPLPIRKEINTKKTSGDLKTTNQTDFKPFKVVEKTVEKSKPIESNLKLSTLSQYKLNFPNWGPSNVSIEKRYHPTYQGDQIKLRDSTTYKSTFSADILTKHQSETQFPKSTRKSTLSLSSSSDNFMVTTSMHDFKLHTPQQIHKASRPNSQTSTPIASSYSQFTTTYSSDFRTTTSSSGKIPNRRDLILRSII